MINIYGITYLAMLLLGFCTKRFEKGKKVFCILTCIAYTLIAGLRGFHVGFDTYNYYGFFRDISSLNLVQTYRSANKDPIFLVILRLFCDIPNGFSVFLFVTAAFFCITVWYYIYKYSENPLLSIIVLLALNIYQFSLTGLRQTWAIGFIILSYIALKENKKIAPYIYILIGSLFHLSALIFIAVPLIKRMKITKGKVYLGVLAFLVIFIFRNQIGSVVIRLISDRGYETYKTTNGLTMMLVVFFLLALSTFLYIINKTEDNSSRIDIICGAISVFFEILVLTQNNFFRLAFYFLIAFFSILPNTVENIKNRNDKKIIRTFLYVVLSIQYLFFTIGSSGILPYTTFWN